jgi:DNA-binding GntR family transcriptional regulator
VNMEEMTIKQLDEYITKAQREATTVYDAARAKIKPYIDVLDRKRAVEAARKAANGMTKTQRDELRKALDEADKHIAAKTVGDGSAVGTPGQ